MVRYEGRKTATNERGVAAGPGVPQRRGCQATEAIQASYAGNNIRVPHQKKVSRNLAVERTNRGRKSRRKETKNRSAQNVTSRAFGKNRQTGGWEKGGPLSHV